MKDVLALKKESLNRVKKKSKFLQIVLLKASRKLSNCFPKGSQKVF